MDFSFTDDQNMIRDTVRKFIEKEYPLTTLRELRKSKTQFDADMWKKIVELGWTGLVVPEEFGGSGLGFIDLMIVFEEMGRGLLHSPFFATVALGALPLIKFGSKEQKEKYLAGIAYESAKWTLAILEGHGDYTPSEIKLSAKAEGDSYVLNGTKIFVSYAHVADNMLVVARTSQKEDGVTVFIVDAKSTGISTELIPTQAQDGRCIAKFNNVKVPKANVLGSVDKGWDIIEYLLQTATILKCAEMAGGAQRSLELSTQYARDRVQFEKPIGSFQAIQFKLVDMLVHADSLKYMTWEAAWKVDIGETDRLLSSMIKAKANDVYETIQQKGIEIHAAIGFTDEMDLALYIINTKAHEFELGGTGLHMDRIAEELEKYVPDCMTL